MLTKLEPIDELIKLILYSAYIQGEDQPVSALIVGEPGQARRQIIGTKRNEKETRFEKRGE